MSFIRILVSFSFLFISIINLNIQTTYAGVYVTSGASGATISWNVAGGSGSCTADSDYPFAADDIRTDWNGSTRGSVSSWGTPTILAAPGSDTTYTFSCTDFSVPTSDSDTITVCGTGRHTDSSTGPCVADVTGVCNNSAAYSCSAGTAINQTPISNGNTWDCQGSGPTGGTDYGCHYCSSGSWDGSGCSVVVNAVCGGTAYTCSAGTYAGDGALSEGVVGSNGSYTWTCNGSGGGSNASCGPLACSATLPTVDSLGWTPSSVNTGDSSTLYWTTSNAATCRWTRSKPGVGTPYYDSGYIGIWPFDNNAPGWSYGTIATCDGTNNSCNGDTWTTQCKNSCNGYSAQSSTGALTVTAPDTTPVGWLDSVSSGNMASCGTSSGWALDMDTPGSQIDVYFYLDGPAGVGTRIPSSGVATTTNDLRSDVNALYPPASGNHGYTYKIPSSSLTPGTHTLYAYAYSTVTGVSNTLLLPNDGVSFTCTGTNPVADAGTDITIVNPVSTTTLSGSATDSDGTIASTEWSFVSGPGPTPTIVSPNSLATDITGMTTNGTYTFRLTATDNHGLTHSDTVDVRRVTNGVCATTHYSCTAGSSANNVEDIANREWTWNCNSPDGGANASCTEPGFVLTTALTNTGGSSGTISPGPGNFLYAVGASLTVTITPAGYVIPPTGASSALYSKGVDGATTTVSGGSTVPLTTNLTMNADHYVAGRLYVPDPVTTTISSTSTHLGNQVVLTWTTDSDTCNLYNWNGTSLVKAIGTVSLSPTVNSVTLATTELPYTIGTFGYIMRCFDSNDINRGVGDANFNINLWCPNDPVSYVGTPARPAAPASCSNTAPSGSIAHSSGGTLLSSTQVKVALGQPVSLSSLATDSTSDLNAHQLEWRHQESNGSWLWSWLAPSRGTVSYDTADTFTETNSHSIIATFTPSATGVYYARFVMRDDMINNPALNYLAPNPTYYTAGGRLSYSAEFKVDVVSVGAEITPGSGSTMDWRCYGSDYVSLVGTRAGNPDHIAVPYRRIVPFENPAVPLTGPSFGSFTPQTGYFYTLTCETADDQALAYYSSVTPTLTENDTTTTTSDIGWNCNNPLARGVVLEREYGMSPTAFQSTTTASYIDTGLAPNTDYVYTLRCYDGWSGSGVTGRLLGTATLGIRTDDNFDPSPIVIDAYIRAKVSDPLGNTQATTTDGTFYDWGYTITSGTPVACTMQQRNDSGQWEPQPGYDTNTTGYTMRWADIFQVDRTSFVAGYQTKHDWRIECVNAIGSITSKTWTLNKKQPSVPIIDTIVEGTAPVIADVTFHCSPEATQARITHSTEPTVNYAPGLGTIGGLSWSPTVSGNYTITCDDGPPLVIFIDQTIFDPFFRLTGTQRTVGGTVTTILSWDISNPDNSCNLRAEVSTSSCASLAPGPQATCLAARASASSTINAQLQGNTDVSDPNGMRTMSEALTMPGLATTNARGKKTITGVRYGTVFIGQCSGGQPVRYRVNVVRENEG